MFGMLLSVARFKHTRKSVPILSIADLIDTKALQKTHVAKIAPDNSSAYAPVGRISRGCNPQFSRHSGELRLWL